MYGGHGGKVPFIRHYATNLEASVYKIPVKGLFISGKN
jgi:creatinine amidohydrolase/Fe(II)-dependent formamide hydrolase-like protein